MKPSCSQDEDKPISQPEIAATPMEVFLQESLDMARAGKLRAIAIVAVSDDDCLLSSHCTVKGSKDCMMLLGETVCLQQRLVDRVKEINHGWC